MNDLPLPYQYLSYWFYKNNKKTTSIFNVDDLDKLPLEYVNLFSALWQEGLLVQRLNKYLEILNIDKKISTKEFAAYLFCQEHLMYKKFEGCFIKKGALIYKGQQKELSTLEQSKEFSRKLQLAGCFRAGFSVKEFVGSHCIVNNHVESNIVERGFCSCGISNCRHIQLVEYALANRNQLNLFFKQYGF